MPRITTKLFFALLYLGILLFVSGKIMHQMGKFTGYMVLNPGQAEQWALRESTTEGMLATALRNMPIELVGLNHLSTASRFFDQKKQYDAVQLPFTLALEEGKTSDKAKEKDVLHVSMGEEKSTWNISPGQHLELFDTTIDVLALLPWSGLLREDRGKPGMVLQVENAQQATAHKLFFQNSSVLRPFEGFSIQWQWMNSEEEARRQIEAFAPGSGRWGIKEEGRVHWFEKITPGDGLIAADGTEYTLIDLEESGNSAVISISVEIKDKKDARIKTYTSADEKENDTILLDPGLEENHLLCLSWSDGSTLLALFNEGELAFSQLIDEEESLYLILSDDRTVLCKLLQVMEKSVVIPYEESPFKEVVLNVDDETLSIRSGEGRNVGDLRFLYSYTKTLPPIRHRLQARFQNMDKGHSFTLTPSKKMRIDSWKLSLEIQDEGKNSFPVVIRIERMLGTPSQLFGFSICLLGVIGLTIFRFADWSQSRKKDRVFLEDPSD